MACIKLRNKWRMGGGHAARTDGVLMSHDYASTSFLLHPQKKCKQIMIIEIYI